MRAAIMQPYFFPYIGYFQLMSAVDTFVFFDDVQYIDRGWVNRNRILARGEPQWWTFPVRKGSRSLNIDQRQYVLDDQARKDALHSIRVHYAQAPAYESVMPRIEAMFARDCANVAEFNAASLKDIAGLLGIECRFLASSDIARGGTRGEEAILAICESLGVTAYLNPIGGVQLYDHERFRSYSIELGFVKTRQHCYRQTSAEYVPFLSVVDVLMHVGVEGARQLLSAFDIVQGAEARQA